MSLRSGRDAGRIAATVLLVSGGSAVALLTLDTLPTVLHGEPRGIVRHATVEAGVAALGAGLLLPGYLPEGLRQTPSSVRTGRDPAKGIALTFAGRDGQRLFLFETPPGGSAFPRFLVPEARPFHTVPVTVKGTAAVFRSVRTEADGAFAEVELTLAGRRVLLRYDGPGDELMRVAESLEVAR